MRVSLIVAVAENGVIGYQNALPWYLPDDLKYFKEMTLGKPVIMGRKTYLSIGRPLPQRMNIVLTRSFDWAATQQNAGIVCAPSLSVALQMAAVGRGDEDEVMVIGGAEVFAQALPLAQRVYWTLVYQSPVGDALMPPLPEADWACVASRVVCGAEGVPSHEYRVFERR